MLYSTGLCCHFNSIRIPCEIGMFSKLSIVPIDINATGLPTRMFFDLKLALSIESHENLRILTNSDHRQSKTWTENTSKILNVADATFVIWPEKFYF